MQISEFLAGNSHSSEIPYIIGVRSRSINRINPSPPKRFPMIGDPTGTMTRNSDVMIEEEGLALRGTFIINPEGIIKTAEVNDLGIGRSAADLVRKIQAAQHIAANPNQACPASWKPGEEALTPSLDLVGKI